MSNKKSEEKVIDLSGRKVFIATPAYEGKVHVEFVNSLIPSLMLLKQLGAEVAYAIYANSGSIPRVRNQAAATTLAGGYTDLVFIDADMGWEAPDLARLLAYNADMVGAAYPARTDVNPRWIVVWGDEVRQHPSGLLTAQRVGTGFLRIRRNVLEKLVEEHPDWHYKAPHSTGEDAEWLYALFDYELKVGKDGKRGHLSEDYRFCDLVTEAGFTIWVDPNVKMKHIGTKTWEGTFSEAVQVKEVDG